MREITAIKNTLAFQVVKLEGNFSIAPDQAHVPRVLREGLLHYKLRNSVASGVVTTSVASAT